MKYIILSFIVCTNLFCMDSRNQLYQKLHTIICDGALHEFENNKTFFQTQLEYQDILFAHHACNLRLQAISDFESKGFTDFIGAVITAFAEQFATEPNPQQFLAHEKLKTTLIKNGLQRILGTKPKPQGKSYLVQDSSEWGASGLAGSNPER